MRAVAYLCAMNIRWISLAAAVCLLSASCGQEKKDQEHTDAHAAEHATHDHAAELSATKVQLNHGEKWQANVETTDGIKRMQSLCAGYSGQDPDAADLANDMQTAYQEIFDKCTMTGAAHDQLHNYLLPLGTHLKELAACTSGCKEHVEHIQAYLASYGQYFE